MKIISWNVNGLRSVAGKGFLEWLEATKADVVGLQEVRSPMEKLPKEVQAPEGWHLHVVSGKRPGYSGVGLYSRQEPDQMETILAPEFDDEARVQLATFGKLLIANVYFPNGKGTARDNSRVPFKMAFYKKLFDVLQAARKKGKRVLVIGDFNTAHEEIDLARPKENKDISGFLIEEREELTRWLSHGFVDTFRHFEKTPGHYSWWSQRSGARKRNVGWRIDYVLASKEAMPFVKSAHIHADVMGSDHCPVSVVVDSAIVK